MNRILLNISLAQNEFLLADWLGDKYEAVSFHDSGFDPDADLLLIDGVGLKKYEAETKRFRSTDTAAFRPVVLLTSRAEVTVVTGNLWRYVDMVLYQPVEKQQLWATIEIALRARGLSKALHQEGLALLEADRASRAKDEFLKRISHELRSPVALIINYLQILARDEPASAAGRMAVDKIVEHAHHELALIDSLLAFVELEPKAMRESFAPLRLNELVEAAIGAMQRHFTRQGIKLVADLDPADVVIMGERASLLRVLANVLANSLKFSPSGSVIRIATAHDQDEAIFELADSGEGIEPASLARVFEPFEQEADFLKRRHGGMGLGLSFAKKVIAIHGGKVVLTSRGKGRGARLVIHLPRSPANDQVHP